MSQMRLNGAHVSLPVVGHWIAYEKVTSSGPSGIGFGNFGTVDLLQVNAPLTVRQPDVRLQNKL